MVVIRGLVGHKQYEVIGTVDEVIGVLSEAGVFCMEDPIYPNHIIVEDMELHKAIELVG